jgi:hypothetical protein
MYELPLLDIKDICKGFLIFAGGMCVCQSFKSNYDRG